MFFWGFGNFLACWSDQVCCQLNIFMRGETLFRIYPPSGLKAPWCAPITPFFKIVITVRAFAESSFLKKQCKSHQIYLNFPKNGKLLSIRSLGTLKIKLCSIYLLSKIIYWLYESLRMSNAPYISTV